MSYSLPRHCSASNIFLNQPSSRLLTCIVSFVLDHKIYRLTTELCTSLLACKSVQLAGTKPRALQIGKHTESQITRAFPSFFFIFFPFFFVFFFFLLVFLFTLAIEKEDKVSNYHLSIELFCHATSVKYFSEAFLIKFEGL